MSDLIGRKEAIEAIKRAIWDKQTAKDAIDAVCNIPSAEPEKEKAKRVLWTGMNDLISREMATEAVGDVHPLDYNRQAILDRIKALPTAEKKGYWVYKKIDEKTGIEYHEFCSECGFPRAQIYDKFCAVCGARMEG